MSRRSFINDKEKVEKIIGYWNKGYTYGEIANILNISRSATATVIRQLINIGAIKGRKRTLEPSSLIPGTVNCTTAVAHKCIYGAGYHQSTFEGLCNYILCEGKSRGCSHKACDKFQTGKKKLPTLSDDKFLGRRL